MTVQGFFITNKGKILGTLRFLVLVASIAIIIMISVDAFHPHFNFLSPSTYMAVQPAVCGIYLADFFASLAYSERKWHFFATHFVMFLISIPFTWLLSLADIHLTGIWAYVLHFVPTLRAVLALTIVVGFVSKNKVIGLFASYVTILILVVYFSSVIFYLREGSVNSGVTSYWAALWWCMLQATTLGASFYAQTTVGKAIAMVLSALGVMMFPLFTVYLSQMMKKYVTHNGGTVKK